jgi:FAD/FMN-containing dehydrogenase
MLTPVVPRLILCVCFLPHLSFPKASKCTMNDFPQNWTRAPDARYGDVSLVYSNVHQAQPAVVAGVGSIAEVQSALAYARSEGLAVAVRGGGHSLAGFGSIANGVVVDLRKLNGIEPAKRSGEFWVGGGALAGEVAGYLGDRALAVPLGDSAAVGIGGITLGGGTGWLTRKFGLTLDSLTAAEAKQHKGTAPASLRAAPGRRDRSSRRRSRRQARW